MALYQETAKSMQEQGLLGDIYLLNPKMFQVPSGQLGSLFAVVCLSVWYHRARCGGHLQGRPSRNAKI